MPHFAASDTVDVYLQGGTTREISAMIRMVLVVRSFRNRLDERLRAINQSAARMETLAAIANMGGDVSQSDVARRLRVEGATVTRMVDLLSKEGLVERAPHPSDRRVNLLRVTALGEVELRRIFRVYDASRDELLAVLNPEDIEELDRVTGLLLDRIDATDSAGLSIAALPARDRLAD